MHDLHSIARKHGFSRTAAQVVLAALRAGRGQIARFDYPELGGAGQWIRGGTLTLADPLTPGLKTRVAAFIEEIASLPEAIVSKPPATRWWPEELGTPSCLGGQNHVYYAYFPSHSRLAVDDHGVVTLYCTEGLRINGFGHASQGDAGNLYLITTKGTVRLSDLTRL